MNIDWTQAPPWAKYAAMDEDGCWFWYADNPSPTRYSWQATSPNFELIEAARPDWTQTLTERPTE